MAVQGISEGNWYSDNTEDGEDRGWMSPHTWSKGSSFILKFSAATAGLSPHRYGANVTSVPAHPLTSGWGMNGDTYYLKIGKEGFPLGK